MGFVNPLANNFFIRKKYKKKINISKLNKISSGKEIIKIINDN